MKWEKVKLREVATLTGGYAFKSSNMTDECLSGYRPVVKIGNISASGKLDLNSVQYHEFSEELESFNIKKGDVLIAMTGATVGKVSVSTYNDLLLNQRVGLIRPKAGLISYRFLHHSLCNQFFYDYCQFTAGGGAQGNISPSQILEYHVPLPPLHIQEQIADTLDKADALRRKDQELLQKYDELAQAIFYDMFGDPVRNEGGWEYRPLSELAEIIMGQSPPGDTYNSEGLGFPLLNGPTEFGELNPTEKQWTTSPTKFCKKNDILFCVRGATAGKLNIADKEYCIGRGLASIRPKTDALSSYLFLYLSNMYDVFQKTSDGSTFINISGDRLKSLNIPLLPEDDLAKFQKMSEKLQENVSVAKKSAGKGIIFFDSIMNYYFP